MSKGEKGIGVGNGGRGKGKAILIQKDFQWKGAWALNKI